MKIRNSAREDLKYIMEIINYAQQYLASLNIDQWQDGYPNSVQILNDISNNTSYVVINDKSEIIATYMLSTQGEATYKSINGKWLSDQNTRYGVIHRIGVSKNCINKGYAKKIILKCEEQLLSGGINSMKIDTHKDNLGMQHILKQLGYSYCGIIKLTRGGIRLAFEKLLI